MKFLRRWRTRRAMRSWHEEHGPPDEILEDFNSQPDEDGFMDSIKGALKSKLVWLGVGQAVYGLFQLWASGTFTAEAALPLVAGAATVIFRALTNESLASKGQ